jgi:flagellar basal-body rod modification protein FlgD
MPVTPIQSSPAAAYQDPTTTARIPQRTLGQEDFLKLLVAQLSAQDPLNPQKDTEFIAQMASFSALEQARSMQSEMSRLRSEQQFLLANSMLGARVELLTQSGEVTSGPVEAVLWDNGAPRMVVAGQVYDMSEIRSVALFTPNPNPQS